MRTTALTPHVSVAINGQARLYHADITTAPATLDAPSTITLYKSTTADVAGFANSPDDLAAFRPTADARLVLIDAVELTWQRARYAERGHRLIPPDDALVSLRTLQLWLWQRLRAPFVGDRNIDRAS